jgi:Protein of unknown function (DUF642)
MISLRLSLPALVMVCGAAHATAANLVVNGSFEQGALGIGSFTGWQTLIGDANTFVDSSGQTGLVYGQASDGVWAAYFGSTHAAGGASISQTPVTTLGQTYLLTFDLANDNGGAAAFNGLAVSVGGNPALSFANLTNQNYAHEQYLFVASTNATSLSFSAYNDASYLELDNVVVSAVPEPGTSVLVLAGTLTAALMLRARIARVNR